MGIREILNNNTTFNKLFYFGLLPVLSTLGKNVNSDTPLNISLVIGGVHLISDYKYKTWPFKPYNRVIKEYPIFTSYIAVPISSVIVKIGSDGIDKTNTKKQNISGIALILMGSVFGVNHFRQIVYRDNNHYSWLINAPAGKSINALSANKLITI